MDLRLFVNGALELVKDWKFVSRKNKQDLISIYDVFPREVLEKILTFDDFAKYLTPQEIGQVFSKIQNHGKISDFYSYNLGSKGLAPQLIRGIVSASLKNLKQNFPNYEKIQEYVKEYEIPEIAILDFERREYHSLIFYNKIFLISELLEKAEYKLKNLDCIGESRCNRIMEVVHSQGYQFEFERVQQQKDQMKLENQKKRFKKLIAEKEALELKLAQKNEEIRVLGNLIKADDTVKVQVKI